MLLHIILFVTLSLEITSVVLFMGINDSIIITDVTKCFTAAVIFVILVVKKVLIRCDNSVGEAFENDDYEGN